MFQKFTAFYVLGIRDLVLKELCDKAQTPWNAVYHIFSSETSDAEL